jgi:flagellar basal-body rod protein FlgC
MKIEKLFAGLNISALGLTAQRKRMNAIANNMANAETTRTEEGGPYKRKIVLLKTRAQQSFASTLKSFGTKLTATSQAHFSDVSEDGGTPDSVGGGVQSLEQEDNSPFRMIYDPSHPDADENGYVKMPNVNVVTEMVDMISASRAYEANVIAVNAAKTIAKDALEI